MPKVRIAAGIFSIGVSLLGASIALGQSYPTKPIRLITTTPGGGSDFVARLTAQGISGPLGQPAIVDNRGRGVIPADTVSKSPPDGYSLLVHTSAVWSSQFFENVPYDPVKDLAPITVLARTPSILVVHPTLPVKSVKDLIALAKARPGQLSLASGATGDISHVAGELFKSMAALDIVRVPYPNTAVYVSDLVAGRVQLIITAAGPLLPALKAGKLRALAVASPQLSTLYPELPTMATSLPGFEAETKYAVWAPAKTPDAIIRRLNMEIVRVFTSAETKQRLLGIQLEALSTTPEEFAALIKTDMSRIAKVVKDIKEPGFPLQK